MLEVFTQVERAAMLALPNVAGGSLPVWAETGSGIGARAKARYHGRFPAAQKNSSDASTRVSSRSSLRARRFERVLRRMRRLFVNT